MPRFMIESSHEPEGPSGPGSMVCLRALDAAVAQGSHYSMAQDGLEQAGYEILSVAESADTVSIFYEYQKAAGTITIAQRFQFSGGLITDILLVFDTR